MSRKGEGRFILLSVNNQTAEQHRCSKVRSRTIAVESSLLKLPPPTTHPPPTYTEVEVGGAQPERPSLCGKMLRTPVGWPEFPRAAHIWDLACLESETPTRPFSNFLALIP